MEKSQMRFLKMAAPLAGLFLASKVDPNDFNQLAMVRTIFFLFQGTTLLVLLWIRTQIQQRNDLTKLSVPQKPALGSTEKTYKEMTRVEYELGELKSALNNLLIGTLIVCGIHFYFGLIPPVIISSIQGVTGLLTNPLYQIHIGGKDVKAPFAEEEGMFEGLKKEWKGLAKMVKTGEIPDEQDDDKSGSGGAPNSKAERRAALLKERKEAKKNKAN